MASTAFSFDGPNTWNVFELQALQLFAQFKRMVSDPCMSTCSGLEITFVVQFDFVNRIYLFSVYFFNYKNFSL